MSTLAPDTWLSFVEREYLDDFVRSGGASVKFAVPLDAQTRRTTVEHLRARSSSLGYLVLEADAAGTRVHMVDQVFHRFAEQVPWQELVRQRLFGLANAHAFRVPAQDEPSRPLSDVLAEENGLEPATILQEARVWIQDAIAKDAEMAKDFRVAMSRLALAELSGGTEGATIVELVTAWLSGRNRAISAVKPYGIRSRIMRTNARYYLESLVHWVRGCGRPGTVLLLDLQRLEVPRNPRDGLLHYTKASLLDTYEVLRQFIDSTDRLEATLLVVVPPPVFLETDPAERGMGAYEALKFRVYDEVRDRALVNPMASLVRLGGDA